MGRIEVPLGSFGILGEAWGSLGKLRFPCGGLDFLRFLWEHWVYLGRIKVPWGSLRFLGEAWGSLGKFGVPWGSLGFLREAWGFLCVPRGSSGRLGVP